jgi:hypothetical protein
MGLWHNRNQNVEERKQDCQFSSSHFTFFFFFSFSVEKKSKKKAARQGFAPVGTLRI